MEPNKPSRQYHTRNCYWLGFKSLQIYQKHRFLQTRHSSVWSFWRFWRPCMMYDKSWLGLDLSLSVWDLFNTVLARWALALCRPRVCCMIDSVKLLFSSCITCSYAQTDPLFGSQLLQIVDLGISCEASACKNRQARSPVPSHEVMVFSKISNASLNLVRIRRRTLFTPTGLLVKFRYAMG